MGLVGTWNCGAGPTQPGQHLSLAWKQGWDIVLWIVSSWAEMLDAVC